MPSKGKKPSRTSPSAAVSCSPSPRTPLAPAREPRDDGGDEGLLRKLLSEASARYPALVSESAFCGRISESDSSPSNGNRATVWLSEAAMVSSSLIPGSLVSVSLAALGKEPFNNFPLDNLAGEYVRHFGINVDDGMVNEAGSYFAIATVFPSRKVLKNGVRLSWGLSCTMGFPSMGGAIFVSSIDNLSSSHHLIKSASVPRIHVCKCKDLYLNMVQQNTGIVSGKELSTGDTSTESTCRQIGNGKVPSPKTPSYQSMLSSPGATPSNSRKIDSFSFWNTSAAIMALADEKFNDLLQTCTARWLSGRHLLNGNFATIPIDAQLCVFRVESAGKLPAECSNQNFTSEGKYDLLPHEIQISHSLDEMNVALLVDTKTKIHLSDLMYSVNKIPTEEDFPARGPISTAIRDKGACDIPRLGGLSKEFAALKEIIMFSLANENALPRYKGVLLHGPPGTGKTSLAASCARDAGACLLSINGPEIVSQYYGESEQALHEVFDSARRSAPAVVFIDELDAIAPARKDGGEELSLRMVATLLKLMDEINRADGILVIAATNRPDSIDPALRRPGRLDREIEIGVPSPEQRLEILQTLLSGMDHSLSSTEIRSLAVVTHGFVGADLAALCNEAAMTALRHHIKLKSSGKHFMEPCSVLDGLVTDMQNCDASKDEGMPSGDDIDSLSSSLSELTMSSKPVYPSSFQRAMEGVGPSGSYQSSGMEEEMLLKLTTDDFEKAKMKVRPTAMREVMLELPDVRWEDVGGQNKVKKQLIEAVQWPQICPDAFERIGIRPPRGLLLIGPPGCSKTLMARAVASEAKLNFLAVKGPELFSKWVGESEKAVRSLFAKARANSPAIIFFDEIDGLAITRGQENDGVSVGDRVLSQLLVEMDGLDQRIGVTVIAATNRPDKIDHALLRPGRFDRLLDVQPPDEADREDIFRIHMRNMPCSSNVRTKDLARLTDGYTGADIKLICREAAIAALEESLEISKVSMAHFKIGIGRVPPSDVRFYQDLAAQFRRIVDTGSGRDE